MDSSDIMELVENEEVFSGFVDLKSQELHGVCDGKLSEKELEPVGTSENKRMSWMMRIGKLRLFQSSMLLIGKDGLRTFKIGVSQGNFGGSLLKPMCLTPVFSCMLSKSDFQKNLVFK
ncbi:hypothetical protein PVL29_002566 [Vitis rotundifolia]|uniref:Uncharacterized protein n=1 Tax=Vitis rotundifolia TaxID=103349 RepID=A0AA39E5U4_VITRO|nr:hypothetical protein PVL29_002566 [Vitis rotundifolia]